MVWLHRVSSAAMKLLMCFYYLLLDQTFVRCEYTAIFLFSLSVFKEDPDVYG